MGLITQFFFQLGMHSQSFRDTELKRCRWVEDSMGQVIRGVMINSWVHWGIGKRVEIWIFVAAMKTGIPVIMEPSRKSHAMFNGFNFCGIHQICTRHHWKYGCIKLEAATINCMPIPCISCACQGNYLNSKTGGRYTELVPRVFWHIWDWNMGNGGW